MNRIYDPLNHLYTTDDLKKELGSNFCGPGSLPHGEATLIALFPKDSANNGHEVQLYCCAMPAEFFTIKVLNAKSVTGEERSGFSLVTGSGERNWAVTTSKMLNAGMLDLQTMFDNPAKRKQQ